MVRVLYNSHIISYNIFSMFFFRIYYYIVEAIYIECIDLNYRSILID